MNWTGGRLQQSKRSGTAITAKQRAYFARARARLLNGDRSASPPQFSLLNGSHVEVPWTIGRTSEAVRSSRRPTSQRRLHEFAELAPTVKHLASITPRAKAQISERGLLDHAKGQRSEIRTLTTQDVTMKRRRTEVVPDQVNITYDNGVLSQDSLKQKRLELLQRSNWFEIPTINPLNISFPSTKEREQIGRRRKLTKEEVKTHLDRVKRRRREALTRHCLPGNRHSSSSNNLDHDHVSVRIGGSIHGSQWTGVALGLRLEDLPHSGKDDEMLFSSEHSSQFSSVMVLDDGMNGKELWPKQNSQSSQSLGVKYVPTLPLDIGCTGQSLVRKTYASTASTNGEMQDLFTLESQVEGENTLRQRHRSDREIGKSLVDNSLNSISHNPLNMRLVFGSQQHDTSSIDSNIIRQLEHSWSERRICAQASDFPEECELDQEEEEWRGFLDISGSSDVALADESLDFQSQHGETGQKDETNHKRVLVGVRRSSSPLEVSAYEDADDGAGLSIGLGAKSQDVAAQQDTAQQETAVQQCTAAQTPNYNIQFHGTTKQLAKNDTPDENKVWYKFVFGHEMDDDNEKSNLDTVSDSVDKSSAEQPQPVSINSPDSLAVQTSGISSILPTAHFPPTLHSSLLATASSTSPPPSMLSPSLPNTNRSSPTPYRILFKRPTPFIGLNHRPTTLRIGHASSSSPLTAQTRRRGRKVGLAESTRAEVRSMESGIEDEDEDDIED